MPESNGFAPCWHCTDSGWGGRAGLGGEGQSGVGLAVTFAKVNDSTSGGS